MPRPKNWSMANLDKMATRISQHKGGSDSWVEARAALISLFGLPSK